MNRLQVFIRVWRWEAMAFLGGTITLVSFWFAWVYALGLDTPLMPSHLVFLFFAMFKVAVYTVLARVGARMLCGEKENPETAWKTWAVLLICLVLASLG